MTVSSTRRRGNPAGEPAAQLGPADQSPSDSQAGRGSTSLLERVNPGTAIDLRLMAESALRSAAAMFAGFVATTAVALVLWTMTPDAIGGPEPFVRGAAGAYVLAHFGDVSIDGAQLTMTPLLLPMLFAAVVILGTVRGRPAGASMRDELVSIGVGALSYGILVTVVALTLAPVGARDGLVGLWAAALAAVALTAGSATRPGAVQERILDALPGWARAGGRAGAVALGCLLGGAAVVVAVALVLSFSTAAEVTDSMAGDFGGGLGLTVVGLGYLPNAVLAAVGFISGVGFRVGAGSYSPFGSIPADLPPLPLLAVVPADTGTTPFGLATMAIPIVAGVFAGISVIRNIRSARSRLQAVLVAGGVTGLVAGLLVALAGGGVVGGQWAQIGADGWRVGGVNALVVIVVAGAWVLAAGGGGARRAVLTGVLDLLPTRNSPDSPVPDSPVTDSPVNGDVDGEDELDADDYPNDELDADDDLIGQDADADDTVVDDHEDGDYEVADSDADLPDPDEDPDEISVLISVLIPVLIPVPIPPAAALRSDPARGAPGCGC